MSMKIYVRNMSNNNELDDIAITPLLFQAGYLTLDDFTESGNYRLRFPNYEVKSSFLIGVNFDVKKRNLDEWEIEKIS